MREIKFRVWDKLDKRFIYPDKGYQGHYVLTLGGEFYNLQNGSGGDDYIVQQYTGLNDKNSKEIYEGDILHGRNSLYEIKWGKTGWWMYHTNGDLLDMYFYQMPNDGITYSLYTIIGNVFENPELL